MLRKFKIPRLDVSACYLVGIILLASILRFYKIGHKSLGLDEAVIYWISQNSINDIITSNARSNSAPFLFPIIVSFMSSLGDSEALLRFPSAVFGVAAVVALYLLVSELFGRSAGLISATFLTVSETQVFYSQYLREYSFTLLLSALLLWAFFSFLRSPSNLHGFTAAVIMGVGMCVQYGFFLMFLGLQLSILCLFVLRDVKRESCMLWLRFQWIPVIFGLFSWFLGLKDHARQGFGAEAQSNYLAGAYWDGTLLSAIKLIFVNTSQFIDFSFSPETVGLLLVISGLIGVNRLEKGRVSLLVMALVFIIFLGAAFLRIYPYSGHRQMTILLPIVYTLIAVGFLRLYSLLKFKRVVAVSLIAVLTLGFLRSAEMLGWNGFENIKPAVDILKTQYQYGDDIFVYPEINSATRYYLKNSSIEPTYLLSYRENPEYYLKELEKRIYNLDRRMWLLTGRCRNNECEAIHEAAEKLSKTITFYDGSDLTKLELLTRK